jgi:hypothetical protein
LLLSKNIIIFDFVVLSHNSPIFAGVLKHPLHEGITDKRGFSRKEHFTYRIIQSFGHREKQFKCYRQRQKNPTIDTIEKVANGLGVPISHLFEKPNNGNFTCPNCGAELRLSAIIDYEHRDSPTVRRLPLIES